MYVLCLSVYKTGELVIEASGILVADITIKDQKYATLSRKYEDKVLANNLFALRVPSS